MKRALRLLAVPSAAMLLLASCGTNDEPAPAEGTAVKETPQTEAEPVDGEEQADKSDSWPIVEDGPLDGYAEGISEEDCDPNLWDEVEGMCLDGAQFESVAIEGAFGFSEGGGTFTLGAPEALPDDIADLLSDAGVSDEDIDKIQLIPVEIDNTEGFEADNLSGATAVTEDGVQHEFQQLGGYLSDVGEQYAEAGKYVGEDTVYDELWDLKDEAYSDVAPTAKSTQYLVVNDGTDLSGKFTYFELRSGDFGSPFPMFPKLG